MTLGGTTSSLISLVQSLEVWRAIAGDEDIARVRIADALIASEVVQNRVGNLLPKGSTRTNPEGRARMLAIQIRYSELDDILLEGCVTPGSITVPVVLALLPLRPNVSVSEITSALSVGYATVAWCAQLIGGADALIRGDWPSRAVASLGAAATAAVLLGLNASECQQALALAAASVWHGRPAEPGREILFGWAVGLGVTAAQLAAEGVEGDEACLRNWPYKSLMAQNQEIGQSLSDNLALSSLSAARIKPFCSAQQGVTSVLGFQRLLADGLIDVGSLQSIDLWVPAPIKWIIDRPEVRNRLDSIASIQYQLAVVINDPARLWDVARTELLFREKAKSLARIVHVHSDSVSLKGYPSNWPAKVQVTSAAGTFACTLQDNCVPAPLTALEEKISKLSPDLRLMSEQMLYLCVGFSSAGELLGLLDECNDANCRHQGEEVLHAGQSDDK